jgi:hypothetical protein
MKGVHFISISNGFVYVGVVGPNADTKDLGSLDIAGQLMLYLFILIHNVFITVTFLV